MIQFVGVCFICGDEIPKFSVTPFIETEDGSLHSCCEKCADKNLPNWRDEEE